MLEVDHIIPLSEGGTNNLDNLQLLCKSCHYKKHKKGVVASISSVNKCLGG